MVDGERERVVRGWAEEMKTLRGALMPILHRVNHELGAITPDDVAVIANVLNQSVADVHGVVSFYDDFRTHPKADCHVQLCRGEACQANGATALVAYATERYGIALGEQTEDGRVGLEQVFCFGNCALGPTATVNGELHGRVTPERLDAYVNSSSRRPAEVPR